VIFLFGCASNPPEVVTKYETVTLYQDRYVPIDPRLINPVEIVLLPVSFDTLALGAAYKAQKTRAMQCNGQLAEIARIEGTKHESD
jgi:hypothetical protein